MTKRVKPKVVKITLADRLVPKLRKFGVSERKATGMAKALVPFIRSLVKAIVKEETAKMILQEHADAAAEEDDAPVVPIVGNKAVKVNGHSLRLDLPVVPMQGIKGIEMLRVMDGLSSTASYLVAAVKGDRGIVAVRELGPDTYNVKFYPNFAYWDLPQEELAVLGAEEFFQREYYQRAHFTTVGLDRLLNVLAAFAKPKSRVRKVVDRFLTIATDPLLKAFLYLYQKAEVA